MKLIWTKRAIEGWQEVANYIYAEFGALALQTFEERTTDAEKTIQLMSNIGSIEWNDSEEGVVYRYVVIHRRSKMLYYTDNDVIYISDFWDVRKNR
jgi:plasmid stabilization system protein ParE